MAASDYPVWTHAYAEWMARQNPGTTYTYRLYADNLKDGYMVVASTSTGEVSRAYVDLSARS